MLASAAPLRAMPPRTPPTLLPGVWASQSTRSYAATKAPAAPKMAKSPLRPAALVSARAKPRPSAIVASTAPARRPKNSCSHSLAMCDVSGNSPHTAATGLQTMATATWTTLEASFSHSRSPRMIIRNMRDGVGHHVLGQNAHHVANDHRARQLLLEVDGVLDHPRQHRQHRDPHDEAAEQVVRQRVVSH